MGDLQAIFTELGLSLYLDVFIAEGFDTWETVLDITESDLTALNVRLGHRRKLQRAIAEYRGLPRERSLQSNTAGPSQLTEDHVKEEPQSPTIPESRATKRGPDSSSQTASGGKRKYRRHPKPDESAPKRPPSAYVLFSNDVRKDLAVGEHSFTEIAKIVGERWQVLDMEEKESYEDKAAKAKSRYNDEMTEYVKTVEYKSYQEYLNKWHARQTEIQAEKNIERSKPGIDSSGNKVADKQLYRKGNGLWQDNYLGNHEYVKPCSTQRTLPASPADTSFSPINSLTGHGRDEPEDQYSSASSITSSASESGNALFGSERMASQSLSLTPTIAPGISDLTDRQSAKSDNSGTGPLPYPKTATADSHGHGQNQSQHRSQRGSSASQSSTGMKLVHRGATSQYSDRRRSRDVSSSSSLPSLLPHDETTLSSDGGSTPTSNAPHHGLILPALDNCQKRNSNTVPNIPFLASSSGSSPTDVSTNTESRSLKSPAPILPPLRTEARHGRNFSDARHGPSMAALLIAGEMARDADSDTTMEVGSRTRNDRRR